jgi:hypothetical protein
MSTNCIWAELCLSALLAAAVAAAAASPWRQQQQDAGWLPWDKIALHSLPLIITDSVTSSLSSMVLAECHVSSPLCPARQSFWHCCAGPGSARPSSPVTLQQCFTEVKHVPITTPQHCMEEPLVERRGSTSQRAAPLIPTAHCIAPCFQLSNRDHSPSIPVPDDNY